MSALAGCVTDRHVVDLPAEPVSPGGAAGLGGPSRPVGTSGPSANSKDSKDSAESTLRFLRCRWCRSAMERGRVLCPVCAGTDLDEETSTGLGTVGRAGAAVRTEERWRYRIRQPCTVLLDEGFALGAVLSADQYAEVPTGARVRVHTVGDDSRTAEFRLI